MPTLMQKIRLALRGWSRRREERNREFIAKSSWSGGQTAPSVKATDEAAAVRVDMEGLLVAHLDTSERTSYYLDTQSGDVIESNVPLDSARYKQVPIAKPEDDRLEFLKSVEHNERLTAADSFRRELSNDRKLERAWFNFRNDRAIAAIDRWLREHRLK